MLAGHEVSEATFPLTPSRRRRRIPSIMGRRRSSAPALPSPSSSSSSLVMVSAPASLAPQALPNTPSAADQAPALQAAPYSRRQPVLLSRPTQSRRARCAEVAGGTAADCTAVCCCCPCGIINLVVLAVVKVPAELCRRAFLKNKKRLKAARKVAAVGSVAGSGTTRRGLLGPRVMGVDEDEDEFVIFTTGPCSTTGRLSGSGEVALRGDVGDGQADVGPLLRHGLLAEPLPEGRLRVDRATWTGLSTTTRVVSIYHRQLRRRVCPAQTRTGRAGKRCPRRNMPSHFG